MRQSSFLSEVPVIMEPERPKSRLFDALMMVGACAAVLWMSPAFLRALRALLNPAGTYELLPSLFEVSLTGLALLLPLALVFRGLRALGMRLRGSLRDRSWEDVLREEQEQEASSRYAAFGLQGDTRDAPRARDVAKDVDRSSAKHTRLGQPVPPLRLVSSTPWPLGSHQTPKRRAKAADTKLGLVCPTPAPSRPSAQSAAGMAVPEPQYMTPYPFSVWSFHDNLPDPIWDSEPSAKRPWVWAMGVLVVLSLSLAFFAVRRVWS